MTGTIRRTLLAATLICTARSAVAQRASEGVGTRLVMGLGYGVAGAVVGASIGNRYPQCNEYLDPDCRSRRVLAGAAVGGTLLGVVGVQLGGRYEGNLPVTIGTALLAGAANYAYLRASDGSGPVFMGSALQLGAIVLADQVSRRTRAPRPTAAAAQGIPAGEIKREMRGRYRAFYTLGGIVAGGFTGGMLGGHLGYKLGYAHDTRPNSGGCEDCGLGGALLGLTIGGAAGAIGGGLLGAHLGARADRDEAVARILARRAR